MRDALGSRVRQLMVGFGIYGDRHANGGDAPNSGHSQGRDLGRKVRPFGVMPPLSRGTRTSLILHRNRSFPGRAEENWALASASFFSKE